MRKGKMVSIGSFVILFVIAILYMNTPSTYGKTTEFTKSPETKVETLKKPKDINEISTVLYQRDGFFEQIGKQLVEKGYEFQTLVAVYSEDDIQVKYVLENKDATESVEKVVKSIFFESVENHSLNANSFTLKVGDYNDGPDW